MNSTRRQRSTGKVGEICGPLRIVCLKQTSQTGRGWNRFSRKRRVNSCGIWLRFFTVYGARQRPDLAIHKFAKLISEGRAIPVFGDGTTRRDYTYIDDIIAGVCAAIDYEKSDYEVFNLGESRTVELNELIALLEKQLGRRALIERQPIQPGDVPQTFADVSKARRLLGYDPQTKIEDGLKRFVEWFLLERKPER